VFELSDIEFESDVELSAVSVDLSEEQPVETSANRAAAQQTDVRFLYFFVILNHSFC
jgi:hypothetical protein